MIELRKLNNYDTLTAIINGLNHESVLELENTWNVRTNIIHLYQYYRKKFSKQEEDLNTIRQLVSPNHDSEYKKILRFTNPPAIPLLSRYIDEIKLLQELESNKVYDDTEENEYINMKKMLLLYSYISELRFFSKQPYNLYIEPIISSFIQKIERVEESTLILKSKEIQNSSKKKKKSRFTL